MAEPVVIDSELDCQIAVERIEELAGCPEDTPEERELVALIDALEQWKARHEP